MTDAKKAFIEFMLGAGVLGFGEFKTKSGRLSPYFINCGNYKTGSQMLALGKFYSGMIKETVGDDFSAIFGPAYKGIPLAAVTAASLADIYSIDKPYFFNRKEAKDHGEGGSLVGYRPVKDDKLIIVEDVITAGTAVGESMALLSNFEGVSVSDMFITVDRCEVGAEGTKTAVEEVKDKYGIKVHSIVNVFDIYSYICENGLFAEYIPAMEAYMKRYCSAALK